MLTIPQPLVPDDDGSADAAVASALSAFQAGTASAADVLPAISQARLLVPVVALLTESEIGGHGLRQEKESEMALPKLVGKDGREAVLAFTSTEALKMWRPDARPIQAGGPQVCHAARQEGTAAVVIDVAGPIPFVIEGGMLQALAAIEDVKRDPSALDGLADAVPGITVTKIGEAAPRRRWFRRGRAS
ncbi:SseB family protein [Microtetraspora malaysiensis]|uniref:SseB family protein n=1 Tax=Microtetraspora malaysiensis TaxID=161358 RepID=UPI00082FF7CB|nr:SseB family protein [Microtetraspora malaysiensis]